MTNKVPFLVINPGFWCVIFGQSICLLPVTRASETEYWTTGRLNSSSLKERTTDLAVSDEVATIGGTASVQ